MIDMINIGLWRRDGELNGWTMPTAPWWKLRVERTLAAMSAKERAGIMMEIANAVGVIL